MYAVTIVDFTVQLISSLFAGDADNLSRINDLLLLFENSSLDLQRFSRFQFFLDNDRNLFDWNDRFNNNNRNLLGWNDWFNNSDRCWFDWLVDLRQGNNDRHFFFFFFSRCRLRKIDGWMIGQRRLGDVSL